MSGIFGLVSTTTDRPYTEDFEVMRPHMRIWGKDRDGTFSTSGAALGHQLFIDTPESRSEQQPWTDPTGSGWTIVADARIDNRVEVAGALGGEPPANDAELLLRAWLHWNERCLEQIIGAFAFVLWHEPSRTLVAARDQMGCRPLHYHTSPTEFIFASDIRALVALDRIKTDLDETALLAKAVLHYPYLLSRTCYRDIAKLAPAHLLKWSNGTATVRPYWTPRDIPVQQKLSFEDAAEQLAHTVETAVRSQLHTIHPVGAHVSGGIDSSTLALLAQRILREQSASLRSMHSWSPCPDPNHPSDSEYLRISAVERELGMKCLYCDITKEDVSNSLARHPILEPTELILYESCVCRTAAKKGIGVLLSGWGGDDFATFSGRTYFSGCFWEGRWMELAWAVWGHPTGSIRAGIHALREILSVRPSWAGKPRSHPLLHLAKKSKLDWRDYFSEQEFKQALEWVINRRPTPGARASMQWSLAHGHLASRMTDWAAESAQHGVVHRYPLLDLRVVTCALSIPHRAYCHQGTNRAVAKQAFSRWLPAELSTDASFKAEAHRGRHYLQFSRDAYVRELTQVIDSGWSLESEKLRRFRSQRAFGRLILKSN